MGCCIWPLWLSSLCVEGASSSLEGGFDAHHLLLHMSSTSAIRRWGWVELLLFVYRLHAALFMAAIFLFWPFWPRVPSLTSCSCLTLARSRPKYDGIGWLILKLADGSPSANI